MYYYQAPNRRLFSDSMVYEFLLVCKINDTGHSSAERLLTYHRRKSKRKNRLHAVILKHPIARQILCRKISEQMKIHSTSLSAICFLSYEYAFLFLKISRFYFLHWGFIRQIPASWSSAFLDFVVKLLGFLLCVFKCFILLSTF